MAANNPAVESHPSCPRCDSNQTHLVSESPVAGAWVIYNCPVCFYSWRSTEPDYATKSEHYNPHFKIRVEDIPTFAQIPAIPAQRTLPSQTAILSAAAASGSSNENLTVETIHGKLRGTREANGARVWRGIPYAAAPIGSLRGKRPQPYGTWAGVREAVEFGSAAVSQIYPPTPTAKYHGSEDCLFANVWAPGPKQKKHLPVLVWIHGGAFVFGSGSEPAYNGADFAEQGGLIFVTINYRLGGFGYLLNSRDSASANLGLLDQIAALKWVQENIASFGGDPRDVTVMGESAGGMSIGILLGCQLAKGLFHKAIIQSGGARPVYPSGQAEQVRDLLLSEAGLTASDEEQLLNLPTGELQQWYQRLAGKSGTALLGGTAFHPAIDGRVLPQHPLENLQQIPTLIGHCKHESRFFTHAGATQLTTGLPTKVRTLAGEADWAKIEDVYQKTSSGPDNWNEELFSDIFTCVPSLRLADGLAAKGADVWSYRFDYEAAMPIGAAHTSDIPFTFGLANSAMGIFNHKAPSTPEAMRVAKMLHEAILTFVKTGRPAANGLPEWPKHDSSELAYMSFDVEATLQHDFVGRERRAAWQPVPIDAV